MERVFQPCVSLSEPARKFMLESSGASWEKIDLANVAVLRKENSEARTDMV